MNPNEEEAKKQEEGTEKECCDSDEECEESECCSGHCGSCGTC